MQKKKKKNPGFQLSFDLWTGYIEIEFHQFIFAKCLCEWIYIWLPQFFESQNYVIGQLSNPNAKAAYLPYAISDRRVEDIFGPSQSLVKRTIIMFSYDPRSMDELLYIDLCLYFTAWEVQLLCMLLQRRHYDHCMGWLLLMLQRFGFYKPTYSSISVTIC